MTTSTVSPQFAAKSLLKKLNINSPLDLRDLEVIAYFCGALVQYAPLDGSEARLSVVGSKAIITVSDEVTNYHRRRFSIAHELGHLEMHRDNNGIAICTHQDLNEWEQKSRNIEREANIFAAAFLLPKEFFMPLCNQDDPSLDLISQLANSFQVSLTATALKFVQFCSEPVAVVYSQRGRIQWFNSSDSFKELNVYVERKVRLDPLSNASHIRGSQSYSSPKRVPVSAWFAKGKHDDDAQIIEHSWPLLQHDAILTLLWVDNDISSSDDFIWG